MAKIGTRNFRRARLHYQENVFWNYQEVKINETEENILEVMLVDSLDNIDSDQKKLFQEQGYDINISKENVILRYENRVGFFEWNDYFEAIVWRRVKIHLFYRYVTLQIGHH